MRGGKDSRAQSLLALGRIPARPSQLLALTHLRMRYNNPKMSHDLYNYQAERGRAQCASRCATKSASQIFAHAFRKIDAEASHRWASAAVLIAVNVLGGAAVLELIRFELPIFSRRRGRVGCFQIADFEFRFVLPCAGLGLQFRSTRRANRKTLLRT
jgi:hypothetical protein